MNHLIPLRRRLVALTKSDRRRLTYDRSGAARLLTDPFTSVIEVPLGREMDSQPELRDLEHSGALMPGAVFVRNVFSRNRYVELDSSWEQFARAKYAATARVCQLLGAHYLEVVDSRAEVKRTRGGALSRFGAATVQAGAVFRSRLADEYQLHLDLGGGPPRPDEAWEYMTERGLHLDATLLQLVELRQDDRNELRNYRMSLDLVKEAQKEFAFGLALADALKTAKLTSGGVAYEVATEYSALVTVEVGFVRRSA